MGLVGEVPEDGCDPQVLHAGQTAVPPDAAVAGEELSLTAAGGGPVAAVVCRLAWTVLGGGGNEAAADRDGILFLRSNTEFWTSCCRFRSPLN